jgi:ADP-ribosyl-[dinitrogen reductase] hydrolase
MAGVYYGYNAIPDRWKEKILVKDQLTSFAQKIFKG